MKGKETKENQKPGEIASPNICESKLAGVALEGGRRTSKSRSACLKVYFLNANSHKMIGEKKVALVHKCRVCTTPHLLSKGSRCSLVH